MIFKDNVVKADTIQNAWRDALWCCARNGYDYEVKRGSYIGQYRKQLESLTLIIERPGTRPLAAQVPESTTLPNPTTEEKIEHYFMNYLLISDKRPNTAYTYGECIADQITPVINILRAAKEGTNQATMQIGNKWSIYLEDPPCLRVLDFKIVDEHLNVSAFFRSWDLYSGMPENIGGIQLLKEWILTYLPESIKDGKIIVYSSGAHIYEMYFDIVDILNVDKIQWERGHGEHAKV